MWQTIDLNNYVDSGLIDTHTVKFNLSAWMGGYLVQDDNARVSLSFIDQFNLIKLLAVKSPLDQYSLLTEDIKHHYCFVRLKDLFLLVLVLLQ